VADVAGPILAWHSRPAPDQPFDVYAARGDGLRGAGWSLPENVSDSAEQNSAVASVAVDPRTWHVAWQEEERPRGPVGVAYARRYEAGWGVVEPLGTAEVSGPPQVLAAAGGAREVVWLANTAVWSTRGFGEGPWQTPAPIPPAAAGALLATVAGDAAGGLHLAWVEAQDDSTAVLRYARRLGCDECRIHLPMSVKRW
jgi:hypothetical protein